MVRLPRQPKILGNGNRFAEWGIEQCSSGNLPYRSRWFRCEIFKMRMNGNGHEAARGVIKHRATDEYYLGEGKWTADEEFAMEFLSVSKVIEEAQRYGIKDCCEFIVRLAKFPGLTVFLPL